MKCEQHKVRESKLPEEAIEKMAEVLKSHYCTYSEIRQMADEYGFSGGLESILSLFNVRGYMIAEMKQSTHGRRCNETYLKTLYKIVTEEDYKIYEEEATKDAKRRLLAAVSCGSTF